MKTKNEVFLLHPEEIKTTGSNEQEAKTTVDLDVYVVKEVKSADDKVEITWRKRQN